METVMKTLTAIALAVAALLLVGSLVVPANALDARKFWDEHPTSGER